MTDETEINRKLILHITLNSPATLWWQHYGVGMAFLSRDKEAGLRSGGDIELKCWAVKTICCRSPQDHVLERLDPIDNLQQHLKIDFHSFAFSVDSAWEIYHLKYTEVYKTEYEIVYLSMPASPCWVPLGIWGDLGVITRQGKSWQVASPSQGNVL